MPSMLRASDYRYHTGIKQSEVVGVMPERAFVLNEKGKIADSMKCK